MCVVLDWTGLSRGQQQQQQQCALLAAQLENSNIHSGSWCISVRLVGTRRPDATRTRPHSMEK